MHRAKHRKRLRRHSSPPPTLRFTPYTWAKLLYLRDLGETEVGGFGISAAHDPLLVEDIVLIRQSCTVVTVHFDDDSVADFFDTQVDQGLNPARFARIWIHTHPGHSAEPSITDEETFERCFGKSDWALMVILACGGETYARLRCNVGPGSDVLLPVEVDFSPPFPAADRESWEAEYAACVLPELIHASELIDPAGHPLDGLRDLAGAGGAGVWCGDEFLELDPHELEMLNDREQRRRSRDHRWT